MIHGQFAYAAGTASTATIPLGASVICVYAESHHAAGAVTIFGGSSVLLNGGAAASEHLVFNVPFPVGAVVAKTGAQDIVFANTTSFMVAYLLAPSSS